MEKQQELKDSIRLEVSSSTYDLIEELIEIIKKD